MVVLSETGVGWKADDDDRDESATVARGEFGATHPTDLIRSDRKYHNQMEK
jgi:hypothetical protein